MVLRLHGFQHVPFEGLGSIASWAREKGFTLTTTRFFAADPMPDPEAVDWLVVMGGPMGVSDTRTYPWLLPETAFIRTAIDLGKTVIGICLGAQLIAASLGAKVYPNSQREIGWFEVRKTVESSRRPVAQAFPDRLEAFHWHGDTFDLPAGSIHLAESDACRHQGFVYGRQVLGLQFHLETTPDSLEQLMTHCASELTSGPFIQSPERMRVPESRFKAINRTMTRLLDALYESYQPVDKQASGRKTRHGPERKAQQPQGV
ncbi:MAG: type 1 glutamine amidotransferase [Desulfobacterales bacterium]